MWNVAQKAHFFLMSSRILDHYLHGGGKRQEEAGRVAHRTLRIKECESCSLGHSIPDSIKNPTHEPMEMPCIQTPPTGPWTPSSICVPHPYPQHLCKLPVHVPDSGSESELWQIATEHDPNL